MSPRPLRRRARTPVLAATLAALVIAGCETARDREKQPDVDVDFAPKLPKTLPWTPPEDWDTMPALAFERMVLAELPGGAQTPFPPETLDELRAALDRMDPTSVRAAVLLGRSLDMDSGRVLLARLQSRQVGPQRNSDSGDVVAAAALARFPRPDRFWRLVRLADGPRPHPDLEVRVECASTALSAGFDRVIPFLLEVLRIDTWEGLRDERDFEPSQTTAWARGRAAQALSARAGVEVAYRADGPILAREAEAARLEGLLKRAIEAVAEAGE